MNTTKKLVLNVEQDITAEIMQTDWFLDELSDCSKIDFSSGNVVFPVNEEEFREHMRTRFNSVLERIIQNGKSTIAHKPKGLS